MSNTEEKNTLIAKGLELGLIRFSEDKEQVIYVFQNKKRKYSNPEEQVQVDIYLKLILQFGYPKERIKLFEPVKYGSNKGEADIIVYNDDMLLSPYIVVECKKTDIREAAFKEAVNQGFTYAVTLNAKYVWATSLLKNEAYEVLQDKPLERILNRIPQIPRLGQTVINRFLYAKGGHNVESDEKPQTDIEKEYLELKKVAESDLTGIFKRAHYALWGAGELKPDKAFDEFIKLIFCKYWDELKARIDGEPYHFQTFKGENLDTLKARILALYEEGRSENQQVFREDINLSAARIQTIVTYLQEISLYHTDLDSKGRAFEAFTGSHFRGDFGQFFTPRSVVQFIVDTLPMKAKHKVLDTSCGSGGFLLYALDKIRKQASEFYDPQKKAVQHHKYWHDFASNNLFGIEISVDIARVAKMNMIIHDDGHTNVIDFDGLYNIDTIRKESKNEGFKENNFDFIITNPPFGSIVKQTEKAYMQSFGNNEYYYKLSQKPQDWKDTIIKGTNTREGKENQATEVLFLEQCYKFLKPNAYLAVVIPDGILTNSSMQYARNIIETLYRIVAVVSLPQTAFQHTGAGVKSSVLFLRKYTNSETLKIEEAIEKTQNKQAESTKYKARFEAIDKAKKEALKKLKNKQTIDIQDFIYDTEQNDDEIKKEISDYFNEQFALLNEEVEEQYQAAKKEALHSYPIFMAIAEDIGYDATGKKTNKNDLLEIGNELAKFIDAIEKGTDHLFL